MDGTPVFSLAGEGLKGCTITGLRGILNSTTNFVLSRLEHGGSIEEAVKIAQKEGFAEANPRYDLEGWDAAAKIAVLANALMDASVTPYDVDRQGILHITAKESQRAVREGKHLKPVCRAWREGSRVRTKVGIEEIPHGDPFAPAGETGSILSIETDLMAPIIITETDPPLYDTAYGVVNDLLCIADLQN